MVAEKTDGNDHERGSCVTLWLVFLLLSGAFTLGWGLGSALGFQAGRQEAEQLAALQAELVRNIELHLADDAGEAARI